MDKNCFSCSKQFLRNCEILESNKLYIKINEMDGIAGANEFKENFMCENYRSGNIEYPIQVSKINDKYINKGSYRKSEIGKFVKVRPCKKEYENKTYLGLYLGELSNSLLISYAPKTKELDISSGTNPAMFVFELNEIIYGNESFWGVIEREEDLKEISNSDIENLWYVKALKSIDKY
ncbi:MULTISPECIES: hypothetical protein [unclassified Clostridioides]|uniref:hypothetical protein n=1 Tax=unclassified Clostridioides TaxID=2635829 RepID=UPI001D0F82C0|nr:hypothetical protein [Clostridioides sp. ES-S-0145-01]MCC0682263.1 hypothetical protein [Clostridioides sp. ES-S-0005-03]MCC0705508.1 hypothetical protein [Clostridioides sp. ES-S-0190-01]UDN63929.1 hypothetical protein IC758_20175 [Clostridioides sp. ES-W-0016-02]